MVGDSQIFPLSNSEANIVLRKTVFGQQQQNRQQQQQEDQQHFVFPIYQMNNIENLVSMFERPTADSTNTTTAATNSQTSGNQKRQQQQKHCRAGQPCALRFACGRPGRNRYQLIDVHFFPYPEDSLLVCKESCDVKNCDA